MSLPARIDTNDPVDTRAVHLAIRVKTVRPVQFIDLTDDLRAAVQRARLASGIVNVQTRHTTTGILVNEHEPLLLTDLVGALERHAPPSADYRHDDMAVRTVNVDPAGVERRNGHAHCQAALLRTSECLNVVDGQLALGRWQRVLFVELDGGQPREISVMLVGCCGAQA